MMPSFMHMRIENNACIQIEKKVIGYLQVHFKEEL